MFKKIFILTLSIFLFACSKKENRLVVGVSPIPHQEIVNLIKDDLKKEGIDLKIVVFNDYIQPNLSLKDKSIDANFFQHIPYMESFAKENNFEMLNVGAIHIEPIKAYSDKIKNVQELEDNAEILIPNDPTNRGRALLLLDNSGIIKLKDKNKLDSGLEDIVENTKNLKISLLNSEQIAARIKEVSLVIINTNNALAAGLTKEKSILVEGKDSPYVNIVAVLKGNENDEKIKKFVNALQSEKVKQFILEKYNEEVIPAF